MIGNMSKGDDKRSWLSKFSDAYVQEVTPTPLDGGTVLVGVIYDCGDYDLLFYEDGILLLVGSRSDTWVSAQPFGRDVAHGTSIADIPALGPAKRPEAQRLATFLRGPREAIVEKQVADFLSARERGKRNPRKPDWVRTGDVEEIQIYRPKVAGMGRIVVKKANGDYWGLSVENNDWVYIIKLLDHCFPTKWRQVDLGEARRMERFLKSSSRQ